MLENVLVQYLSFQDFLSRQIVLACLLILGDFYTTRRCFRFAERLYGREKAIEMEFSSLHKYFWRRFGVERGHIYSSTIELVGVVSVYFIGPAVLYFVSPPPLREGVVYLCGAILGMFGIVFLLNISSAGDLRKKLQEKEKGGTIIA